MDPAPAGGRNIIYDTPPVESDVQIENEEDDDVYVTAPSETSNSDDKNQKPLFVSWIAWFCALQGNQFFCEIPRNYLKESFNMTDIDEFVQPYAAILCIVLGQPPRNQSPMNKIELKYATRLYGLAHARFVLTKDGVAAVLEKYRVGDYGLCRRVLCKRERLLPIGLSDELNMASVCTFCGSCNDIFVSGFEADGAFFGTGLPHFFFMMKPQLRPQPPRLGRFVSTVGRLSALTDEISDDASSDSDGATEYFSEEHRQAAQEMRAEARFVRKLLTRMHAANVNSVVQQEIVVTEGTHCVATDATAQSKETDIDRGEAVNNSTETFTIE